MSVYLIDYENVHFSGWDGIENLTSDDEVFLFYSDNASTIPMELSIKVAQSKAEVHYLHVDRMAKNYLDFQLSSLSGYLVATTEQTEFVVVSKDTGFDAILDFWNNQTLVDREVNFTRRTQIALQPKKPVKKTTTTTKKAAPKAEPKKTEEKKETKKPATKTAKKAEPKTSAKSTPKASPKATSKAKASDSKPVAKPTPGAKLTPAEKKAVRDALEGVDVVPSDFIAIYKLLRTSTDKQNYNTGLVKAFKNQDKANQIYKATLKLLQARI